MVTNVTTVRISQAATTSSVSVISTSKLVLGGGGEDKDEVE